MKIAITGSSGFIGKHLINFLFANYSGIEIIEIDISKGIDITDANSLSTVPEFDYVIHLAGKSFVPDSFINPQNFYYTNVIGTLNILELCRKFNSKIIFFSSYVYGAPEYLPIDENHPIRAFNPYAQSKILCEGLCQGYHRDFNIPTLIFRPFNIYGPGQNDSFLIPWILKQIKNGETIINLKDSRPRRDFIYISDVVTAIESALFTPFDFQTLNIASGKSISVEDLTNIVSEISGNRHLRFNFDSKEIRKNEVLETVGSIKRIKDVLNWEPSISLVEGIMLYLKSI